MDQATQDAAAAQSSLGAGDQHGHVASIGAHVGTHAAAEAARVVFRFGLWPAALELWRIAPTDPKAKQWAGGALERRTAGHAGVGAARIAGGGGKSACAQWRDRRRWRTAFPAGRGRERPSRSPEQTWTADIDALAVRKGGGKFVRLDRTERQISAHRFQPDRHRLHVAVRHAGPRRDRARHRRATHRQGIQRPRMRPGAGAGGRAWASAGRLRDGRGLRLARVAAALRGRARQRAMEPRTIPRRARRRTCRCAISRSRCCPRLRRTNRRKAWRKS